MQPLKAIETEVFETQIAVIGAGGAGLCAAVAAADGNRGDGSSGCKKPQTRFC